MQIYTKIKFLLAKDKNLEIIYGSGINTNFFSYQIKKSNVQ